MKNVRITAMTIINVSGHTEKYQGDVLYGINDDIAKHLVEEIQVAEYLEPVSDREEPISAPEKPVKTSKKPATAPTQSSPEA
ncbi:MAG: hypothetical protein IBX56_07870 [Methylomicrobium sp.]|nr:hypothetical protein [Methylomicrobium sp.]